MADPADEPAKPRANWTDVAALLLVFVVLGLVLKASAGIRKPDRFIITFRDIITNKAGIPEAIVELENKAEDVRLELMVQVATDEVHGTTDRETMRQMMSRSPPWTSMDRRGDTVTYHMINSFSNLNTEVQSSTGTNLYKGGVATFRFEAPAEGSFRLTIHCFRTSRPQKSTLRLRAEAWNAWANAKFGVPVLFESGYWGSLQMFSPLVPKGALTNKAGLHFLGRPSEHRL